MTLISEWIQNSEFLHLRRKERNQARVSKFSIVCLLKTHFQHSYLALNSTASYLLKVENKKTRTKFIAIFSQHTLSDSESIRYHKHKQFLGFLCRPAKVETYNVLMWTFACTKLNQTCKTFFLIQFCRIY